MTDINKEIRTTPSKEKDNTDESLHHFTLDRKFEWWIDSKSEKLCFIWDD